MSKRIYKLLILLLVAAIVSWLFYQNPHEARVNLSSATTWNAPTALILIVTFSAGAIIMFVFSLLFSIKLQFLTRRAIRERELLKAHHQLISEARGHIALGDYPEAKSTLQKIIDKDPEDISARVMLADCFRKTNEPEIALQILETARIEQKQNVELLMLAAELNAELGNHTAAFDNAKLILKSMPKNIYALERLVRDCRELGRYKEAISFQTKLIRLVRPDQSEKARELLAQLDFEHLVSISTPDTTERGRALRELLTRNRDFLPAIAALAEIETENLNLKEAEKLWKQALQKSGNPEYLKKIATVWLETDNPSRAISSVRSELTLLPKDSDSLLIARIYLIELLLHLESIEEARTEFNTLDRARMAEHRELLWLYTMTEARLLQREGKLEAAFSLILGLCHPPEVIPGKGLFGSSKLSASSLKNKFNNRIDKRFWSDTPPASLSTP